MRGRVAAQAVDIDQPRHDPESLYRHEAAGEERHDRREAPEIAAREYVRYTAPLVRERHLGDAVLAIGNREE